MMHKMIIAMIMLFIIMQVQSNGELLASTQELINRANEDGPYIGLIIPNLFEMNPLLQSPNFTSLNLNIDFAGRRFRFGVIDEKKVVLVMTGLGIINAGVTTQLLLSLFSIEGVVHYGTAGKANPSLNYGDVTIPQYWSHTGLWNWQRYGDGPEDELVLEKNGDYTREYGYLHFANYTTNVSDGIYYDNLLNNLWYQPEEIFPTDGTPEERQHVFWIPVDTVYFHLSKKLEGLQLETCLNSTCLPSTPKVVTVQRGTSSSIFLSNDAYKSFMFDIFNVSTFDMETAAVALVCLQQRVSFIAFRAISGGSDSSKSATFLSLASKNSVTVVIEFIKHLSISKHNHPMNQASGTNFAPEV